MDIRTTDPAAPHRVVSREKWLIAPRELLKKKKAHMRLGDEVAAERPALFTREDVERRG